MSFANQLLFAFSLRDRLAAMSWLEMILWFGLASLTLALLVLMGTRWGQVRPVSKCVALSVFAHVLFLAYAYGTNLSFASMGFGTEPIIRVSLNDGGEDGAVQLPPADETAPETVDLSPLNSLESVAAEAPMVSQDPPAILEPAAEPQQDPPALLADQPPAAATPPPALLPDPNLFDPSETIAEPIEIVTTEVPAAPSAEPTDKPAPEPSATEAPKLAEIAATEKREPTTPKDAPRNEADPAADQPAPEKPVASVTPTTPPNEQIAAANRTPPRPMRRPVDDKPLPEVYRLRAAENRLQLALPFGATEQSEAGVRAALSWLAAAQSPDGRWDASDFGAGHETKTLGHDRQRAGETADTGITGLALLAFLGAGNTHVQGDYREAVQHGLEFLLRSQSSEGHLAGSARVFEKMYCHGIAMLALGEAFALTGDSRLQPALQEAVTYTIKAQHPTEGGWRYQPGDRGDISQFGWQVMALRSAQLGGLQVDPPTRSLMLKFLNSATSGRSMGLAGYRPNERVTRTMTAEAMSCRFFLETPPSAAASREATDFLLQELPGQGQPNLYYWYYATLALYQDQGAAWQTWNDALQRHLLSRQRREGRAAGSWDTDDVWGGYGGRVYTTAMGALCLEVYYRYLPLYEQLDATRQADAARAGDVRR